MSTTNTEHGLAIRTARLGDSQLREFLAAIPENSGDLWTYVEDPLCSSFSLGLQAARAVDVLRLWQIRVFGPAMEIAARRLDFVDPLPWQVRLIGDPPPGDLPWEDRQCSALVRKDREIVLYGTATGDGADFEEMRFRRARLSYPLAGAAPWHPGADAVLKTEEIELNDGPIVCWRSIGPRSQ